MIRTATTATAAVTVGRALGAGLALILLISSPGVAFAYNWDTHRRVAGAAIDVMQHMPVAPAPPPGADPGQWAEFLAAAAAAPSGLKVLHVGVGFTAPGSAQYAINPLTQAQECFFEPEGYPFNDNPCTAANEAAGCTFFPDDNLNEMGSFRIQDFRYVPQRSAGPCGLAPSSEPDEVLQNVIGWQAGSVDDLLNDSHFWFRPTNAGFLGKAKGWASEAWTTAAGALLAPIVCVWNAIFGDGCDLDDGSDLAKKYNPIDYADSWIPGFDDHTSSDYPTVWHFFNFGGGGSSLHNAPPGLVYPYAGASYPGVMDFLIMTGAGLSGLSVHASESDGVSRYGQYDDDERSDLAWQAYDIGTIDFSSVDNLARYGWDDRFVSGGQTGARGLAWPLHAIGDSTAPHHVVGTTSWGHRPYEDYIDQYFDDLVYFFDGVELTEDAEQRERILGWAFYYWLSLQQGTGVQQFVTDLGDETRFLVALEDDWPYRDTASIEYHLGSDDVKHMAVEHYRTFDSQIRVHLERAIAASLALLTRAGALAEDPGFDPDTKCAGDSHYVMNVGCVPGPAPDPDPILNLPDLCSEDDPSCQGGGCPDPCTTFADCPTTYDGCIEGCCIFIPK